MARRRRRRIAGTAGGSGTAAGLSPASERQGAAARLQLLLVKQSLERSSRVAIPGGYAAATRPRS
jgi:hypothetical protein